MPIRIRTLVFMGGLAVSIGTKLNAHTEPAVPRSGESAIETGLRVFHVGNSLTDQAYGMHDIAKAKGYRGVVSGRHMIPGAPLSRLWSHRCEGAIEVDRHRPADEACADAVLRNNAFDALIIQPQAGGSANDTLSGGNYWTAALAGNPEVQLYVFSGYPHRTLDFDATWTSADIRAGQNRNRAYFNALIASLKTAFPDRKPARLIPVGEVMHAMNQKMKAGQVPGHSHIHDRYKDEAHLGPEGLFLEAATHFATVYKQNPCDTITSGLFFWEGNYGVSETYAKVAWETIWEVVSNHPLTGI